MHGSCVKQKDHALLALAIILLTALKCLSTSRFPPLQPPPHRGGSEAARVGQAEGPKPRKSARGARKALVREEWEARQIEVLQEAGKGRQQGDGRVGEPMAVPQVDISELRRLAQWHERPWPARTSEEAWDAKEGVGGGG